MTEVKWYMTEQEQKNNNIKIDWKGKIAKWTNLTKSGEKKKIHEQITKNYRSRRGH